MPTHRATRRRLLGLACTLPWAGRAPAAPTVPFRRLAVLEPPYEETYEVLIAMAPPLARGMLGKVLTRTVSEVDSQLKSEALTQALDPARTALHTHFVEALADALDAADARVLRVVVDPSPDEATLFAQARRAAPQADALLLANVLGRFVALHGVDSYAPGVMLGVKLVPARGGTPWLETSFTAGFRGIDPRAEHVEVADLPERFDDHRALLAGIDSARAALQHGVQAIAAEIARRLMA